jgi:hypothetical protein
MPGLYKSVDAGETWSLTGLRTTFHITHVAIDSSTPDVLYVSTFANAPEGQGSVWKSEDGGATWTNTRLNRNSYTVAVDPADPAIVYAGGPAWVYRSVDGAASWEDFSAGLPKRGVSALAVDPSGQRLYAGTSAGVFTYSYSVTEPESAPAIQHALQARPVTRTR